MLAKNAIKEERLKNKKQKQDRSQKFRSKGVISLGRGAGNKNLWVGKNVGGEGGSGRIFSN